jgi:flagellar hook-associated protein 3 FlgL
MRVTEGMVANNYLNAEKKITEKQVKISTQLANNSKIQTLSDDVSGSLESISLYDQIKKTEAYINNSQSAYDFMDSSLNSLELASTQLQNIISVSQSAVNALNNGNSATMAQSVKDSLSLIVNSVNQKQNDMYLFGGTNYQDAPVSLDANGKAVLSALDHSGETKVQISTNSKEAMNIPGSKIFATGIFTAVNDIIDSLNGGTAPTQAQLDSLTAAYKEFANVQSLGGEKMNRLTNMKDVLSNQKTFYNDKLTKVQGIDTAALSTELSQQDYLLQVTYKLLANALPKSVFDYL